MVAVPMAKKEAAAAPALTADQLALIAERDQILVWLEPAKKRELEIRNALAAALFPSPTEGINKILTADGFEVSLDHKINRKLDEAALDTVMMELPEDAPARQPGYLVVYKPALVLSGLRALPEDQAKIFAQALTETPGSPTLAIAKAEEPATPIMDAYEAAKNASPGAPAPAAEAETSSSVRVSKTGRAAAASSGKIKASQVTQRMRDVAEAHKKPKAAKPAKGRK